jgi:hypothetical protein
MYRTLLFLSLLFTVACSTTRSSSTGTESSPTTSAPAPAPSYAGDWDITIKDTPAGTFTGVLSIAESADGLTGTLNTGGDSIDLSTVKRTEDGVMVEFYSPDYQMDIDIRLKGDPDAPSLTGTTLGDYMTVATRK